MVFAILGVFSKAAKRAGVTVRGARFARICRLTPPHNLENIFTNGLQTVSTGVSKRTTEGERSVTQVNLTTGWRDVAGDGAAPQVL